jgi:hypothetical protein
MPNPQPLDPKKVSDQEAETPEIVRFLREALQPDSPQNEEVVKFVEQQLDLENFILEAVAQRVPAGIVVIVLKELQEENYRLGVRRLFLHLESPESHEPLRRFIKKWFAKKGVHFDYKDLS